MTGLNAKTVATLPLIALVVPVLGYHAHRAQARPQTQGLTRSKLIGTWRVASYKYGKMAHFAPWPKARVMLKHITPTGFTMVTYDARTGAVQRVAGGTYKASQSRPVAITTLLPAMFLTSMLASVLGPLWGRWVFLRIVPLWFALSWVLWKAPRWFTYLRHGRKACPHCGQRAWLPPRYSGFGL